MLYTPVTKNAIRFCYNAHAGQLDKAGLPYVNHPLHLAEQMTTEDETCVALLHDVMEDCGATPEDLLALGISPEALAAVQLLTHKDGVPYLDYVRTQWARIPSRAASRWLTCATTATSRAWTRWGQRTSRGSASTARRA
jgi:(p)ppGpp synthase/HD superfamily hydrolase